MSTLYFGLVGAGRSTLLDMKDDICGTITSSKQGLSGCPEFVSHQLFCDGTQRFRGCFACMRALLERLPLNRRGRWEIVPIMPDEVGSSAVLLRAAGSLVAAEVALSRAKRVLKEAGGPDIDRDVDAVVRLRHQLEDAAAVDTPLGA